MKTLLFIILTIFCAKSFAASDVLAPFLEGSSGYVDEKAFQRSLKFFKADGKIVGRNAEKIISAGQEGELGDVIDSIAVAFSGNRRDERKIVENALNICRFENRIDDVLYRLLLDTMKAKFPGVDEDVAPGPAMSLSDYLTKKRSILKYSTASRFPAPTVNPFPKNKFSFTVGQYRNLSAQEMIFYTYKTNQIRSMAKVMNLALNVMDAESVVTTVNFRDKTEEPLVIVHSASDQYRFALRLMKMEKTAAERDSFRIGRPVKNIDLIISSYLLGGINHEELGLVVHDKNFYLPEVSMEKKALKYVGQLALLGLKLHPVTAPYVIIPILLYNTYVETKKLSHRVDEDSFLFTLPGEK